MAKIKKLTPCRICKKPPVVIGSYYRWKVYHSCIEVSTQWGTMAEVEREWDKLNSMNPVKSALLKLLIENELSAVFSIDCERSSQIAENITEKIGREIVL